LLRPRLAMTVFVRHCAARKRRSNPGPSADMIRISETLN
jgi:hypothetical protein